MSVKEEMESWRVQSPEEPGFHAVITPDTCACQETQIFRLNLPKGESYHLETGKPEMHPVLITGAARLSDHALSREMKCFDAFYLPGGEEAISAPSPGEIIGRDCPVTYGKIIVFRVNARTAYARPLEGTLLPLRGHLFAHTF